MRIFILFGVLIVALQSHATTYYIAATGNDSNTGTSQGQAFATISRANMLNLSAGDSLLFHRGDRFFGALEISDNGSLTNPIFVGAYGTGAMPELIGGDTLVGWSLHTGSIYKRQLSQAPGILSVDDETAMLAREPNTGWFYLDVGNPNTTAMDAARVNDPDWSGANLLIMENDWSLNPFPVTAFNSGTGTFTVSSGINPLYTSTGVEYCIVNHPDALDRPGEWYYDAASDTLYLWTLQSDSPDDHLVLAGREDYGVFVSGNYVEVSGLRIRCYNHSGIRFNNRHHVMVRDNEFHNIRRNGVYSLFGFENTIRENAISQTGLYGILGFDSPDALVEGNRRLRGEPHLPGSR